MPNTQSTEQLVRSLPERLRNYTKFADNSTSLFNEAADLIESLCVEVEEGKKEIAREKEAREVILEMRETWIRRAEDAETKLKDVDMSRTPVAAPCESPPSFGCILAMRVLQSDLYRQLDDAERAECDELVARWHDILKRTATGTEGQQARPNNPESGK